MSVQLHKEAFAYAKQLIKNGKVERDEKDQWSKDQPTTDQENTFLQNHDMQQYELWFLGINTEGSAGSKERYEFPYGDFSKVHRGGVIAAKVRAGQYHHKDIENAANELLAMIDTGKNS